MAQTYHRTCNNMSLFACDIFKFYATVQDQHKKFHKNSEKLRLSQKHLNFVNIRAKVMADRLKEATRHLPEPDE